MIRIANGQGFWGDWLEAPVHLIEDGPLDYLTLDYLAEVTMSILQKQKSRDPQAGYARDFPPLIARIAGRMKERGVTVIANAGGVNPQACAAEIKRLAPELKIAMVLGDDVYPRLDDLLAAGHALHSMDTDEPLATVRDQVQSANAYLGAFPIAEAIGTGADVVITGRCADSALALAPMIHTFGWGAQDWDLLAAGTVAGHIVECGSQTTGGNSQVDWQNIPDLPRIGYPIVEAEQDGTFIVTKHKGTGGTVSMDIVKEQLLYEVGDPCKYVVADCVADFTSIRLEDAGPDRVRVSHVRGKKRPESLKLSISYHWGWKAVGTLVYSWPQAYDKAQAADRIVRERLRQLGLTFDEVYTEFFGYNACHGPAAIPPSEPGEIQLRVGVRARERESVERFTRELIPLVLSGPPTATGYGEGRPQAREVVAFWPALLEREQIKTSIEVVA